MLLLLLRNVAEIFREENSSIGMCYFLSIDSCEKDGRFPPSLRQPKVR
jgi:hypothetical protein